MYGNRTRLVAGVAVALALSAVAHAAPDESASHTAFAAANAAYRAGDHNAAIRGYEALVAAGVRHENLYYNLGNAYFRADRLGPAIYNYERALRLAPDLDDARHNLALSRDLASPGEPAASPPPRDASLVVRAVSYFAASQLAWALLVLESLLCLGVIAVRASTPGPRRAVAVVVTAFAGAAFAVCAALFAGHAAYTERAAGPRADSPAFIGVVLPDDLALREGTDVDAAARAHVRAGRVVRVVARDAGWLRIQLHDGAEGWVPRAAIGEL